jgi:hypothetical protein
VVHQIMDTEVAGGGIESHHRIAVKSQVCEGRGDNAACLVIGLSMECVIIF